MLQVIKYLALFIWILPASCVYQAFANETETGNPIPLIGDGKPHVIWRYTFRDNGDQYNPYAERDYLTCTYIGPLGEFKVPAEFSKCPWVKMFVPGDAETALSHRPWR